MSPPGNLTASTLVRLAGGEPPAPTLALVAAVALHEAVSVFLPPLPSGVRGSDAAASRPTAEAGHPLPTLSLEGEGLHALLIKWPNDLLLGGVKLSGILLERADDAVVVGFGVNLAHHPVDLDRAATSLAAFSGNAPDPDTFLAVLADSFARWLHRWRQEGLAPILTAWLARAHPIGTGLTVRTPSPSPFVLSAVEGRAAIATPAPRTSTALSANGEGGAQDDALQGLFDGLDASGALRLRLADGSVRVIHAADVFMIQD